MEIENSWYYKNGFNFSREDGKGDIVAIMAYKVLMDYTLIHRNCRIGAYLYKSFYSEFFPLSEIIIGFDLFEKVALTKEKISPEIDADVLEQLKMSFNFYEQLEKVWLLEYPVWFEFESSSIIKDIIGYKFNNVLRVKIFPNEIKRIEGTSLKSFSVAIKDFNINIKFGSQITIY